MEQGGWLDQVILGILQFVTQSWVELVVGLGGGVALAVLARLSPRRDWEEITGMPGKALVFAVLLLASLKSVPRAVFPTTTLRCDDVPGTLGIPQKSCHFVAAAQSNPGPDFTLLDMIREIFVSVGRDALLALIGWALASLVLTAVLRLRGRPAVAG